MYMKVGKSPSYLYIGAGLIFLIVFGVISYGVVIESSWIDAIDLMIIDVVQSDIREMKTMIISLLTEAGNIRFIIAGTVGVVLSLFIKRWYAAGLWFGGTILLFAVIGTRIMKKLIDRSRPDILPLIEKTTESFPSGHATAATIFYGLLLVGLILIMKAGWRKIVIGWALLLLIGFIIISRVYLGVHFPTDVFAGFFYGIASVFISIGVYQLLQQPLQEMLMKFNLKDESMLFLEKRVKGRGRI